MVSIKEIAQKAKCHESTVSRALSAHKWVNVKTRKKILKIAKELNYRPNVIAKNLATRKTHTLGIIAQTHRGISYSQEILEGAEEAANILGYKTLALNCNSSPNKINDILETFIDLRVDGILFFINTINISSQMQNALMEFKIPLVTNYPEMNANNTDCVLWSVAKGASKAVEHLAQLGHKRIGHITVDQDTSHAKSKLDAYLKVVADYGLDFQDNFIATAEHSVAGGFMAMQELLESGSNITAVFVNCDLMALGAMKAVLKCGLTVPGDISVVGFDNMRAILPFADVPLTTVDPGKNIMGKQACKLLINRIENKLDKPKQKIYLNPELIVRDSCRGI
jgi:LacI family transcriptional regulator, galactose operon repressor